ncbi:MYG1 family protein [Dyadobacter sp. NIV53]|uniref:MYG1 family protein n=1 Tax=Dyadobacter sp. NIV53 TaxID=2861765 RepID=UPI001C86CABB|nr:MYG1 family protein [Dyadobacter sp. NIV53]
MHYLKVITHDTTFHADEIFAVALLKYIGYQVELSRTRNPQILAPAIADPSVAVLDVGGEYNPLMFNFDHHQDMALQSAAGLIYENFKNRICPPDAQPFFGQFISSIDAMDTNRDNIFELMRALPSGFRNTSSIIGRFNRDVTNAAEQLAQFEKALDFAAIMIENELYEAIRKAKSEADYANRTILPNNVAVFDEYSAVWKNKNEHVFVVLPHANGWQIQTIDTTIATVPESITESEGFIFRHGSGFMAVVKDKEVAVSFAETL